MQRYALLDLYALELFAGTGNSSYELVYHGCLHLLAVDQHACCCAFVLRTAAWFQLPIVVQQAHVFQFSEKAAPADLIFAKRLIKTLGNLVLKQKRRVCFNEYPRLLAVRV